VKREAAGIRRSDVSQQRLVNLHSQLLSHVALLGTLLFAAMVAPASAAEKPKVRTITAFIRLDTTQYKQQVTDTLTMLRNCQGPI